MKKTLVLSAIVSAAIASGYADDDSMQAQAPVRTSSDVYLSGPAYCFEIYGTALLLQPTSSNLYYAAEANPLPAPTPNWFIHKIDTDYQWAFDIGIAGVSHCTNSKIALNWEHFRSSDSATKNVGSQNMIGPFFEIGPDAATYKNAHGNVKFHFDEVNLDYGVYTNLGDRLNIDLAAGLGFARIKQTMTSKYYDDTQSTLKIITTPSTFTGAGPEASLDMAYKIVAGFHLTGNAGAGLFVGPQKNNTTYQSWAPSLAGLGITPPNYQTTTVDNKVITVPVLKGKLGLDYDFMIGDSALIRIEAGYQAQVYLNAIQTIDIGSEVVTPPVDPDTVGVYARTFQNVVSNFSLAGPYFKLLVGF